MVEYRAGKGLGDIEINNQRGTVQVMLPKNAAFQIDAHATRGDIESDFPAIQVEWSTIRNMPAEALGSGGPQVKLTNDRGDVQIRQSTGAAAPARSTACKAPQHAGCSAVR